MNRYFLNVLPLLLFSFIMIHACSQFGGGGNNSDDECPNDVSGLYTLVFKHNNETYRLRVTQDDNFLTLIGINEDPTPCTVEEGFNMEGIFETVCGFEVTQEAKETTGDATIISETIIDGTFINDGWYGLFECYRSAEFEEHPDAFDFFQWSFEGSKVE